MSLGPVGGLLPVIQYDPLTGSFSVEPSKSDWDLIARLFGRGRSDIYIDYSPDKGAEAYRDSAIRPIQNRDGTLCVPYQLVFDYRDRVGDKNWGKISFVPELFAFPGALARHKTAMVAEFERRNLLGKGNQPAIRVLRCEVEGETPHLFLQEAHYNDQVGTNLTVDYPWDKPVVERGHECHSVREWDVVQAHGSEKRLPGFESSRLANTLGIAIGMTARSKDGRTYWLRRKRSKTVAVYAGMWHVPFSFALSMDEHSRGATDLRSLIAFDLAHERAEELGGLDYNDFGELRPIAFCRDLARGGKPQLFLELPCLVPFEHLTSRARDSTSEFASRIELIRQGEEEHYSPELACFLLLTGDARSGNSWK